MTRVLIGTEDRKVGLEVQVAVILNMMRSLSFILAFVDEPGGLARGPFFLVQVQPGNNALHQPELVVCVQDLEILRQVCFLPVHAEQPVGDTMERPDPHSPNGHGQQRLDSGAHFGRRLVGKGDGEDAVG